MFACMCVWEKQIVRLYKLEIAGIAAALSRANRNLTYGRKFLLPKGLMQDMITKVDAKSKKKSPHLPFSV